VIVVLLILFSAVVAGYQAVQRFYHPQAVHHLGAVAAASVLSFLGNEGVAMFRIKVGKEIGSAALVADGYHSRTDGWGSLAVLTGAVGVWLGFPLADPIAGFVITLSILYIVWQSGKDVFTRLLDGVDPEVLDEVAHAVDHVKGVKAVGDVKARWVGHKLRVEMSIAVRSEASLSEAHAVAHEVRHQLMHHLPHLEEAVIHVDQEDKFGSEHHRIPAHTHDGRETHSH